MTFDQKLSRRKLLKLGGATLVGGYLGQALGQAAPQAPERVRIGMVLPTTTGTVAVRAATYQLAADAARAGALMAEEELGAQAEKAGRLLEVRVATAPDTESAIRAAERLTSVEEVFAFAGGFGAPTALALSGLAQERQLPFFNIGAADDALRGASCNRYTFHVEASAAMYVDALTDWYVQEEYKRWFYVYPDSDAGRALYERAKRALGKHQGSAEEVGASTVDPQTLEYSGAISQLQESGADVALLLLDAVSQLSFMGELDNTESDVQVTGFPDSTSQTRTFLVASKNGSPRSGTGYRASLWEAKLEAHGARTLNQRFRERWGTPMDGPAWAAYQTVKILYETVASGAGQEADAVIDHLENPATSFDLYKGPGTTFRPWDHQLRQPLYMIKINTEAQNAYDLANFVAELPAAGSGVDARERLDSLGDLSDTTKCTF